MIPQRFAVASPRQRDGLVEGLLVAVRRENVPCMVTAVATGDSDSFIAIKRLGVWLRDASDDIDPRHRAIPFARL
jgi:hypothetical protein